MKTKIATQKATANKHNHKLVTGSTIGKYPIVLDGGKTIIYISDKRNESEIRRKYAERGQHHATK